MRQQQAAPERVRCVYAPIRSVSASRYFRRLGEKLGAIGSRFSTCPCPACARRAWRQWVIVLVAVPFVRTSSCKRLAGRRCADALA